MRVQVAIVGAGVVGGMVAYLLSRTSLRTVLIEAGPDVCVGASRANSGIVHAGFATTPGSLMARCNVEGNQAFDGLASLLGFPFKRIGSLVCAQAEADLKTLEGLLEKGHKNGVAGLEIWDSARLKREEPNLNAKAALYAPTAGIVSPFEMTYALCRYARENGVTVITGKKVTDAQIGPPHVLMAGDLRIEADLVINAAGLYSDEVAKLAGDSYAVTARKGEYLLLDRSEGSIVNHTLFPVPTPTSKGILVTPTVDGNLLLGPTATPAEKGDTSTSPEGLREVLARAVSLVQGIKQSKIIAHYAGLRAVGGDDFIIRPSQAPGWINLVGIQSPGLTAAPAIAQHVLTLIPEVSNLELTPKASQAPQAPKFSEDRVICRCETVGRAQILEAIEDGAETLDGIKLRCRAGAGRCQGSTCRAQIAEILAEAKGIPVDQVTRRGDGSWLLAGPIDKRRP